MGAKEIVDLQDRCNSFDRGYRNNCVEKSSPGNSFLYRIRRVYLLCRIYSVYTSALSACHALPPLSATPALLSNALLRYSVDWLSAMLESQKTSVPDCAVAIRKKSSESQEGGGRQWRKTLQAERVT